MKDWMRIRLQLLAAVHNGQGTIDKIASATNIDKAVVAKQVKVLARDGFLKVEGETVELQ